MSHTKWIIAIFVGFIVLSCNNKEVRQQHAYDILSSACGSRDEKADVLNGIDIKYIDEVKKKIEKWDLWYKKYYNNNINAVGDTEYADAHKKGIIKATLFFNELHKDLFIVHFKAVVNPDEKFRDHFVDLLRVASDRAQKANWNFGESYPFLQHQLSKIIGLNDLVRDRANN